MFGSVEDGAEKYIMPFKYRATHNIDTFISYEINAYKMFLSDGLRELKENETAKTLLRILDRAEPVPEQTIPKSSLIREFIGGSSFDTVVQICRTLGICALGEENIHLTEDTQRILDQYAKLDDYGRHTIASVIQVEYDRCTKTFEDGSDLRGGYSSVNLSAPVANDEPVSMNVLASRED